MDDNLFAPTASRVEDVPVIPTQAVAPTPLFAITDTKLAILLVCTMGLYDYYWFYRN